MYKSFKSSFKQSAAFVAFASAALAISSSASAQLQPSLPTYQPGSVVSQQSQFTYPATQISNFAAPGTNVIPNGGSAYPYLPNQNLSDASKLYVDGNDSRTDTVTYSPYLGRAHGNLFYKAPINRQLVDDRPHIVTTSSAFQGKFANRRAGARQLDAQHRRSGYRIIGAEPQQQIVIKQPSERKIRIVRYPVPVRVNVNIDQKQAQQRFVQQLQTQQVPTQNLYVQSQQRAIAVQPSYSQYYTNQAAPVQYGTAQAAYGQVAYGQAQYAAPSFQQGATYGAGQLQPLGQIQPALQVQGFAAPQLQGQIQGQVQGQIQGQVQGQFPAR